MTLYFDIGNTYIKILFNDKYHYLETSREYSAPFFFENLPQDLQKITPSKVLICSVVPQKEEIIAEACWRRWKLQPLHVSYQTPGNLTLNVKYPERIGADIIALAAFLGKQTEDGVIVNMGTATTIVHVQNNSFEGGIIMPGLEISKKALIDRAAKLADLRLEIDAKTTIGKTTEEAISIGILKGQVKMIEGLVADINPHIPVYVSGGNSELVKHLFTKQVTFVKEATLEGIKIIEKINHL